MKKAELVFIPFPAIGHLISAVDLAKLLVDRDECLSITFLIMKLPLDLGTNYIQSAVGDSTRRIRFVYLPQIDGPITAEPLTENPVVVVHAIIDDYKGHVRDAVGEICRCSESGLVAGFIVDMFCISMIDVADELGIPTYAFFTSGAGFLSLKLYLQTLSDDQKQDITELKDSDVELTIPGFTNTVSTKILPSLPMEKNGGSALFLRTARFLRRTKGVIINTFLELESNFLYSFFDSKINIPPIYPVGPIINHKGGIGTHNNVSRDNVVNWLDDQPPSSVVFLCFGSMGSFEEDQVKKIADGIESSGHRFLWSLRKPPPVGKMEFPQEYTDPAEVLPEGFLERTSTIGKVIGWAPQLAVLSHPAVGGFVSHCGWNSILESVWCGVPLATWPMYAEQQINAFEMVKELGMAVEIKMDYRKENPMIVTAQEIERGIRHLMMDEEENQMRKKAKEMREKSRIAMTDGGSSFNSLGSLIEDIMSMGHKEKIEIK